MKTKDVYLKTMKFVWLKLALGAAITLVSTIILGIFMLIGYAIGGPGIAIMLVFWMMLTSGIYRFAMYCGYCQSGFHRAGSGKSV